jgi:hypothetical protein
VWLGVLLLGSACGAPPPVGRVGRDDAAPHAGQVTVAHDPFEGSWRVRWSGFRDEDGIAWYEWALGSAPGAADLEPWRGVERDTAIELGEAIVGDRAPCFVSVRAWDRAGNSSAAVSSPAIDRTPLRLVDRISRYGITWSFDRRHRTGRFANGDPWILGPVLIVGIDPPSRDVDGRVRNGAMLDPRAGRTAQGYDSAVARIAYEASLNVALDVGPERPLRVQPGSSLVSTISVDEPGSRPQLRTAAVLTVLAEPPPPDGFRPPYAGVDKALRHRVSDLDRSRLRSLRAAGHAPALETVERWFERPWLDHRGGFEGRCLHPVDNMPDYGREMASRIGDAALVLHLDLPESRKETLLRRFVQLGIDLAGVVRSGGEANWTPDGGHASGRKWPILFAGLVLGDDELVAMASDGSVAFGEDAQTFFVARAADGAINGGFGGYGEADLGLPEWGIRHATDPSRDDRRWEASYRTCCTANAWVGFVLAARLAGASAIWRHDALFAYMDRYMATTRTGHPDWQRSQSPFAAAMWDRYRSDAGGR